MIKKADSISNADKKIRILIAGYPGIGKSTLALSAPNPLHIDVDFGIDRIEPRYRKDYIQPKSYDEILADFTPENVKDYDSLVFDTGGKLISLISLWAMKKDPKYGQRDGSLSLKGYGFVGKEFQRLMDYCFYELDKHIVMVFHAIEDKDGDNTRLRIKVEGQTKKQCLGNARSRRVCGNVWKRPHNRVFKLREVFCKRHTRHKRGYKNSRTYTRQA